ncbi:MAG: InlB B-repeat-containing protein, partial [Christensenellales bacterium]
QKGCNNNYITSIMWTDGFECDVQNAYALNVESLISANSIDNDLNYEINSINEKDFTNGVLLNILNNNVKSINSNQNENDFIAKVWSYSSVNYMPSLKQSVKVTYKLNGVLQDKVVIYDDMTNLTNAYIPLSYRQNIFEGWYLDENCTKKADLSNVSADSLTLYAKWTPFENQINTNFALCILGQILILLLVLYIMYLIDRKKLVTFIKDGKVLGTTVARRGEKVSLPSGYENKIWFKDERGEQAFEPNKMPYKSINLYLFNDKKQAKCEKAYKDMLERQRIEREKEERQRQIEIENREKQKAEIKKQKEELRKQREQEIKKNKELQIKEKEQKSKQENVSQIEKEQTASNAKKKEKVEKSEKANIKPLKIRKNASKGEENEINKNSNSDITVISKEIKVIKNR